MIRSPFFYVGDKYKLMPQISSLFPENINRLIEPFAGGGSVFLNTNAKKYLANDKNEYMVKLHKFLFSFKKERSYFFSQFEEMIDNYNLSASFLGKNVSEELKKYYVKTYYAIYNKDSYNKLKKDFNSNKQDLLRLYTLLIYGFNHMLRFNSAGNFNLPVGNVDYNSNVNKSLNDYFDFVDRCSVTFTDYDYEQFINSIKFGKGDFVYLDPPYLISDSEYNKLWSENDEIRLLETLDNLNSRRIKFALSNVFEHKGRKNQFLINWSKKYKVFPIKSNYISFNDNTKKSTKEVLIVNYG